MRILAVVEAVLCVALVAMEHFDKPPHVIRGHVATYATDRWPDERPCPDVQIDASRQLGSEPDSADYVARLARTDKNGVFELKTSSVPWRKFWLHYTAPAALEKVAKIDLDKDPLIEDAYYHAPDIFLPFAKDMGYEFINGEWKYNREKDPMFRRTREPKAGKP
jgi:hypothetical protein